MNLVLAVIIIILIIVCFRWPLIIPLGVGLGVWYALRPPEAKQAGDWDCDVKSGPYGSRCKEGSKYANRSECETFCLTISESLSTTDNIRKFFTERGYKFPIPQEFLDNMQDNDFSQFLVDHVYDKIVFAIKIPLVQTEIYNRLAPNTRKHSMTIKIMDDEYMEYVIGLAMSEPVKKYLQHAMQTPAEIRKIIVPTYSKDNQIGEIFNAVGTNAIDLIQVSIYDDPHANTVIINHELRRVTYFEPHVGREYDYHTAVTEFLAPLEYTTETTASCPRGLQSVTGDKYCASWSVFGALLILMNPHETLQQLLAYLIGQKNFVSTTMWMFLYYIHIEFGDFLRNTPPGAVKFLVNVEAKKYQKLISDIEALYVENKDYGRVLSITKHIKKILDNFSSTQLQDYCITDYAKTCRKETKMLLKSIEHGRDLENTYRIYFDTIASKFNIMS
jgi:hypothetical protein